MICELRIVKPNGAIATKCNTFEETISLMIKEFTVANGCEESEAVKMLASVNDVLENLPNDTEFTAWEIEDHDNNNELTACIIRKISN
jgi:hypothetical protein